MTTPEPPDDFDIEGFVRPMHGHPGHWQEGHAHPGGGEPHHHASEAPPPEGTVVSEGPMMCFACALGGGNHRKWCISNLVPKEDWLRAYNAWLETLARLQTAETERDALQARLNDLMPALNNATKTHYERSLEAELEATRSALRQIHELTDSDGAWVASLAKIAHVASAALREENPDVPE